MRMDREKLGFILLAVASLAGIVILAAALDGFAFASPFQLLDPGRAQGASSDARDAFMRLAVFLIFALLPLVAVLLILVSHHRRRMLLFLLLLLLMAYLISTSNSGDLPMTEVALVTITAEALQSASITPQPTPESLPAAEEVGVTPALVWLLSLGLAGLLAALAVLAWLVWRGFRRQ